MNLDRSSVTVSGVSSGGYAAVQVGGFASFTHAVLCVLGCDVCVSALCSSVLDAARQTCARRWGCLTFVRGVAAFRCTSRFPARFTVPVFSPADPTGVRTTTSRSHCRHA